MSKITNTAATERPFLSNKDANDFKRRKEGYVVNMDFPQPTYPGRQFPVYLLGIDDTSYSHVHLVDPVAWILYTEFMRNLKEEYCMNGVRVPFEEIEEGMFVIARVRRNTSAFFVRAEVLGKRQSNYQVRCMNVDEFQEFVVPKEQVFFACKEAQGHPKRAIKAELAGLSSFIHTDFLKQAFDNLEYGGRAFTAELFGSERTYQPTLRLTSPEGQTLTTLIQQQLYQILPRDHPFFD